MKFMFVSSSTALLPSYITRLSSRIYTSYSRHYTTAHCQQILGMGGGGVSTPSSPSSAFSLSVSSPSVLVSSWIFWAARSDSCVLCMRRNPSSRVRDVLAKPRSTLSSNLLIQSRLFAAISIRIFRNSRSWKWPLHPGFSGLTETRGSGRGECAFPSWSSSSSSRWSSHLVSSTAEEGDNEGLDSLPVIGLFTPSKGKDSLEEFSLISDVSTTIILASAFQTPGSVPGLSGFSRIGMVRQESLKLPFDWHLSAKYSLFVAMLPTSLNDSTEVMEKWSFGVKDGEFFTEALAFKLCFVRFALCLPLILFFRPDEESLSLL